MANKPDYMAFFEAHVKNLNLSRTDDFIINSLKLTYFSGWADAMNSLTSAWFEDRANRVRAELEQAVRELQAAQTQTNVDEFELDLSEPDPVVMDYSQLKVD